MNLHAIVLVCAIGVVAGCSKQTSNHYKTLSLSHIDVVDKSSPEELIAKIVNDRTSHIDLAISKGGLSVSAWEDSYEGLEELYQMRAQEFAGILGEPSWQGPWTSDDYPDWALGEEITIWEHAGGPIYLRIFHEDQELPIIVALGTKDSTNGFNAEGESPYKANREFLKSQGEL